MGCNLPHIGGGLQVKIPTPEETITRFPAFQGWYDGPMSTYVAHYQPAQLGTDPDDKYPQGGGII